MDENNKFDVVGTNIAEKATMIWNVADMLRGPFKPHEYGLVILPMTVVKRFHDCLLPTHKAVLEQYEKVKNFAVRIFTESICPSAFGNAAMESYMEAQDSYGSLFEDKSKYDAVMSALAGVIYREMRSKKTVDYRKIERDEQVQMVAEEPVKYGE